MELERFTDGGVYREYGDLEHNRSSSCAGIKRVAAEMIMKIAVIADDDIQWKGFVEDCRRLNPCQPAMKC